jgi:tetratricopeptide (TPR) repeat protein
MDWKDTAVAAVVSLLFLLQGISTWRRAGTSTYRRWLGVLTILLAFLGVSSHFLLASGAMVFGLEFGIVMVQGTPAWAALLIVLVGLPISAAMGVHVSRSVAGRPPRWAWPLIAGGLVGVAAISRLQQLEAAVDLIAPIRGYDIWWPVLPAWVGVCFVWSILSIAHVQRRSVKLLVATALGLGFSLWAVSRNLRGLHYADPMSAGLWSATLALGLPVLLGTTAWIAVSAAQRLRRIGRLWCVGVASLAAITGLVSSSLWLGRETLPLLLRPWFLWAAASAVSAVLWILSLIQRWKAGELHLPDVGKPGRWDDAVAVCALLAIAIGLADGLYFMQGMPVWDLVAALVGWAIFVEVVSVGPLADFVNRPLQHSLQSAKKILETHWKGVRELAMTSLKAFADGVKAFFTFSSVGVGVLRFVILAAVLVAIAELPNAGKTVIVPFTELGLSDAEARHFGRMLSHRVVNRFATLARDLEPEVAIVRPADDRSKGQSLNLVASGDTADRPEAVVSGDLEINTVKIPISLITSWIQTPMRALLGVRVVTGSVQKEGGGYLLLAQSSDGGTFRVRVPGRPAAQVPPVEKKGDADEPRTDGAAFDRTIAANSLADELAYKLISTVPEMANAGMTQSWQAVEPYSKGLEKWTQFQTGRDFDALTEAIVFFRRAVQLDPNFALAHHRLGLALTADNQPFVATDALRKSLQANRNFVLGYHALASHLYFNRSTDVTPSESSTVDQGAADKTQAQMLWHQLLRFPRGQVPVLAQADAHAGLCRLIFEAPGGEELDQPDAEYIRHYIAYFHCHRALQLFATLPATVRDSPDVRRAEGRAWFTAGWILNDSSVTDMPVTDGSWLCSKDSLAIDENGTITNRTLRQSPYTDDAVKYYDHASALLPDDNTILCTRAEAAFARDRNPMQAMDKSSEAHRLLAEDLVSMGTAGPVKLALEEYETAFKLDPQNLFARNGYGYAVWQWFLKAGRSSMSILPDDTIQLAEDHARHAARLAVGAVDRADAAAIRSTLGEVLMMQGRWHEAYTELEAAESLAPKHPFFDEIRWDLGLAYLCAGVMDRRPGRSTSPEMDFDAKAAGLFTAIRVQNEGREIPSLGSYHPVEHHIAAGMCHSDPSGEPASDDGNTMAMPYELLHPLPRTDSYEPCTYLAVTALVVDENAEEAQDLKLRVIGPGFGAAGGRVAPEQVLRLPWKKDTHDLYFAQLGREDGDGFSPVSSAYAITTAEKAPCSNNRIVLEFEARSAKETVRRGEEDDRSD